MSRFNIVTVNNIKFACWSWISNWVFTATALFRKMKPWDVACCTSRLTANENVIGSADLKAIFQSPSYLHFCSYSFPLLLYISCSFFFSSLPQCPVFLSFGDNKSVVPSWREHFPLHPFGILHLLSVCSVASYYFHPAIVQCVFALTCTWNYHVLSQLML